MEPPTSGRLRLGRHWQQDGLWEEQQWYQTTSSAEVSPTAAAAFVRETLEQALVSHSSHRLRTATVPLEEAAPAAIAEVAVAAVQAEVEAELAVADPCPLSLGTT